MFNNKRGVIAKRLTLLIAGVLAGACASDLTAEEIAAYEAQGAYADDDIASSEQALDGQTASYGFVWANNATIVGSYAPSAGYTYNSAGGANRVTHLGVGRYRVDMPSLRALGNTQVQAYGSNSNRCKLHAAAYSANGGVRFDVNCFNYGGTAADSQFVAFYNNTGDSSSRVAMATVDSLAGVEADAYVRDVDRISTGRYTVKMPLSMTSGGTPFVTAMGTSGNFCNPASVYTQYSGGTGATDVLVASGYNVDVRCFNSSGAAADSAFQFTYINRPNWISMDYAGAIADETADHAVNGYYSGSGAREMVWFDYSDAAHSATFYDVGTPDKTSVLVNAFTTRAYYCKPTSWGALVNFGANIACYDTQGSRRTVTSSVAALSTVVPATLLPFSS